MQSEVAKQIVAAAERLELKVTVREGYSGRGMFGRETVVGVVGSRWDIEEACAEAGVPTSGLHWDNMGLDIIAY